MIARHVPMRTFSKSDFSGLVSYITDQQSKTERLGQVTATNCLADTLDAAVAEVIATQLINTRAVGDKTYHLILAFPSGEHPDERVLKDIEARICEGLGYGEHQRISAVHHDTDHWHMHIAINKIHPTRNTMHEPFLAYRTLGGLCVRLEEEHGLQKVNHEPRRTLSEGRAGDMECHSGIESLLGWIRRECLPEIKGAETWQALHHALQANGLELKLKGNGFVFEAGDGTQIKASTVGRDLSKPKLEARLGVFEAAANRGRQKKPKREYLKKPLPMRVNTVELYAKYKAEQTTQTVVRQARMELARKRRDGAIEDAKRAGRHRRGLIKHLSRGRLSKRMLYSQASSALLAEMEKAREGYKNECKNVYESYSRRTWVDWLKQEAFLGNDEALAALRAREAAQGLRGNTVSGKGKVKPEGAAAVDSVTKKGTVVYRVGKTAVRDDGDKLQVSREASYEGVKQALRFAQARYGDRITVNGTAEFKAQTIRAAVDLQMKITFTDPVLEARRRVIMEKEKGNDRENDDRRRAGRGTSGVGSGSTSRSNNGDASRATGRQRGKPNIGGVGGFPPPESKNRLRGMSELGLVRISSGSEVLLPRHVSSHLEQQGAQSNNPLRRDGVGARLDFKFSAEQVRAMDKYIAEREEKRVKGFDISKHKRYNEGVDELLFGGLRRIDDQDLILLKREGDVLVMPIDPATASRLRRTALNEPITMTAKGVVKKSKGRGL